MPEEIRIEVACDASTQAWGELTMKYGAVYVEQHYEELAQQVKAEVRQAIDEAERDWYRGEEERRQAWLDDYYEETSYGWYQQDIIDMYRRER